METLIRTLLRCREARRDPDVFVETCLTDPQGRLLRQAPLHRELQRFLTDHPRALAELPRDHGKSTQVCGRILWELGRDPSLRVKIVCASEALAVERSRFLRDALEHNPRVRLVFPNLRPARPWGETRFAIDRPASVIGPSVTAVGIGGASTGARADLLVCDDIVDVRSIASRAERERVKQLFRDNLMNLLEPTGRFWGLCTPWHRDDLNAELKQNPAFGLFRRAIDEQLTPIWPERWPRRALEERRREIGAVSFARGYRLAPLAGEDLLIPPEWVRYWETEQTPDRVIIAVDPAVATHARADATGIVTLARCGNQVRCLGVLRRRITMPDLLTLLAELDAETQPEAIVLEANAAFRGLADVMTRRTSFGPRLRTVTHHRDKAARVAAFSVPVQNGLFLLRGDHRGCDPGQRELLDEMISFPVGEHDDLLDAAAFGTEFLLRNREPRVW